MKLLKDFYLHGEKRLTQHEFNSYQMETPVIIQESYTLTVDVKKLQLTQSMQHVTSKSLVIITSNDQIYTLEAAMFTARRQTKAEEAQLEERKLEIATTLGGVTRNETDTLLDLKSKQFPPYDGVIPQRNTKFISYDMQLVDLRKLYTFSTRLESTTGILATGHDIFFARIAPEGSFDRLHENFKGVILLAVVGGLTAALYAVSAYTKGKDLKETFLKR